MHVFDDSKVILLNLDVSVCRLQEGDDDSSEMVSRPAAASQILRFAVGWGVGSTLQGTVFYRPVDEMLTLETVLLPRILVQNELDLHIQIVVPLCLQLDMFLNFPIVTWHFLHV